MTIKEIGRNYGFSYASFWKWRSKFDGMVESFNVRIADMLKTHRFTGREDLQQARLRYVTLYNHQLPKSALKSSTAMQAMKDWHRRHPHPDLFNKRPHHRPTGDKHHI